MFGVNLAGAEFGSVPGTYGVDYTYPTASELDYYASKGVTLIRLPFLWERMQPALYGSLDPAEVSRMTTFLSEAHADGIQVILDAHDYGRYNGNVVGSAAVPVSAFQDFWTKMATQFGDNAAVGGFDLMNEPHDMGGATVWPTDAQAAVNGIRTVDMHTPVYVEGDGWSSAASWQTVNANLNITDPANKIVYEAHLYFDSNNSGTYSGTYDQQGAYPTIGVDRLQPFADWLAQHNAQGFIGEFGVPDTDPRWLTVLDNFLAAAQHDGISGTYWAGGPWWGSYPLSIEPVNGTDRPQMTVLEKYLSTGSSGGGSAGGTTLAPQPFDLPASGAPTNTIDGGHKRDVLIGTAANDLIDGMSGNDHMSGGLGDDTYVVNSARDQVTELANAGIDTVQSWSSSFTLPANVENLQLFGTGTHLGTGNELNNLITASATGSDTISGGSGNDILIAGKGADILTGGAGTDMFVFTAATSQHSTVIDFHPGEDLVDLRPLMQSVGYAGTDPAHDGTISLQSDGSGGTLIHVDPHNGAAVTNISLAHVAPQSIALGSDVLWH